MGRTWTGHVTRIYSANNLRTQAWQTCLHSSRCQPCTGLMMSFPDNTSKRATSWANTSDQILFSKPLVLPWLSFLNPEIPGRGVTVMNDPGSSPFPLWTKKITSSCFQWGITAKEQYQQPRLLSCWGQSYLEVLSISFLYLFFILTHFKT